MQSCAGSRSGRHLFALDGGRLVISGAARAGTRERAGFTVFDGRRAAITYDRQADVADPQGRRSARRYDSDAITGRTPPSATDIGSAGDGIIVGLASSPSHRAASAPQRDQYGTDRRQVEAYGRAVVPAPWNARQRRW